MAVNMREKIKLEVPEKPGCYLYYNKYKEVIYVGKAKNLRKRMISYFNNAQNIKTIKLVNEIHDFTFVITNNEKESLILENNLIKANNPRYNMVLKDDKTYPYIVVTAEQHPRIIKTRTRKLKGEYFGPFPSATFVNEIIKIINRKSKLRKCYFLPKKGCIYYHLDQCYAPCIKDITDIEVQEYKQFAVELLKNNMGKLNSLIKEQMKTYAGNLEFEKAQEMKLILEQIKKYKVTQGVQLEKGKTFDVIDYYNDDNWVSIAIINVVDGIVTNINLSINAYSADLDNAIISSLFAYYENHQVNNFIIENNNLQEMVQNLFLTDVTASFLKTNKNLIKMAKDNAREYYKNNVDKITKLILDDNKNGYEELRSISNNKLELIEMYDISHLAGDAQVGVKIAYKNGLKEKKLYRKYKIKKAASADEYGSLNEMLERRITRMIRDNEKTPNLIILDGGKAQVKIASEILKKYGLYDDIMLLGLVKDKKHNTRAMINKNNKEIPLNRSSKLYKFLYELQEEVHRFAINFHHKARSNSMTISALDNIYGLGPKRRKLLIEKYDTVANIKLATKGELKELGIPEKIIIQLNKL